MSDLSAFVSATPALRVAPRAVSAASQGAAPAANAGGSHGLLAASVASAAALGCRGAKRASKLRRRADDDAYGASHTSFYTDAVAKEGAELARKMHVCLVS